MNRQTEIAESIWKRVGEILEKERDRIFEEIKRYPPPIPHCDQQFNYLLEQQSSISQELNRLRAASEERQRCGNPAKLLEEFIQSSRHIDVEAKQKLAAHVNDECRSSPPAHQGQLAGTCWEPNLYLKFSDHRLRPALELLDRVPLQSPNVIYDLGCGTGQVTRIISDRWPAAKVFGLDNSREMLAQAAAQPGRVKWIDADIRNWSPDEPPDLIYSNATLHWVEDHHSLFLRLVEFLKPGGCLAVQMPLSWNLPSHRLMRETLANGGPDGKSLGTEELRQSVARDWVHDAQTYYDFLAGRTHNLDIWETEYLQILEGEDPVLEWVKGTGLRPILNSLDVTEREWFLGEYARRLRTAYPARADGRTLYPFRRLFLVASI